MKHDDPNQDERPDPDALLARAQEAEQRRRRGRLKIFQGYAAGVGKTYSMLEAARLAKSNGVDVLAGYVETHGRRETEALLEGLDVLPRRVVEYRGVRLEEFDLDGALARRPALVLLDELAHSNAPGSRHLKRWQDAMELLAAGADVFTTLNVQHLESLNDVVARITGVTVRETLPDIVLDEADAVEVVDLPPPELLRRLREGKVYVAEQAARALHRFFQEGNLMALRELAFRSAAERVDGEMRAWMESRSIEGPWDTTERLLVCVSGSPYSERLIRAARRLAGELRAEWHAVYVETEESGPLARENRENVWRDLRLAESLGARVMTLTSPAATDAILDYSRKRNITKIVVGKPARSGLADRLRGTVVDRLIRRSRPIDVIVVGLAPDPESRRKGRARAPAGPQGFNYAFALGLVVLSTLVCAPIHRVIEPANLVMVYLLAVVVAALRLGLGPAILTAFTGVLAFDFFLVPPAYTLAVHDTEYLITFLALFTVGAVVASLVDKARSRAEAVRLREIRTESLYALSRDLASAGAVEAVAEAVIRRVGETLDSRVALLLPGGSGLEWVACSPGLQGDEKEMAVAQWVHQNGKPAGLGVDTLGAATLLHLPLRGADGPVGVLAVAPRAPETLMSTSERALLDAYANQISLALERVLLSRRVQQARLLEEAEKLHRAIMNSLSHDLRTPLVTITGAISSLREEGDGLPSETRRDLLEGAWEEACRLNRLMGNLFDMSRLEAGILKPRLEPVDVPDLVGAALSATACRLGERDVRVDTEGDVPPVPLDFVLMTQVLVNLLDNAAKFSGPATPVTIGARVAGGRLELAVEDRGPGIPEEQLDRVFDKFFRVQRGDDVPGSGLGLAICKGIVEAHGGTLRAENRPGGGARFVVTLPIPGVAAGAAPSGGPAHPGERSGT
ncbi:MAG: sensor histidine kinase KdpD [Acidobacteria bacterium]|nr:sensor histidine kinase KdpD [Acidobacteriota bacterium]